MEHIKDVIARLFESQWGHEKVQAMSKGRGTGERRTYSPSVNLIMQLSNTVKDWEIGTEDLYDKKGYSAQLWTDKKTGKKMLVFFKRRNRKGVMPVLYVPLANGQKPAAVIEEALNQLSYATDEKTLAA
jgi:hypothetical protein